MPPKPLRQPTRKEAVCLPQNARFNYLSQVSQLLSSEGYLDAAAYFGVRALKAADNPSASVPRRNALQHCEVCGVFLSPASCSSVVCVDLSQRSQLRSSSSTGARASSTSFGARAGSVATKCVNNVVVVVRVCKVCNHRNSQPYSAAHVARQVADSEAREVERLQQQQGAAMIPEQHGPKEQQDPQLTVSGSQEFRTAACMEASADELPKSEALSQQRTDEHVDKGREGCGTAAHTNVSLETLLGSPAMEEGARTHAATQAGAPGASSTAGPSAAASALLGSDVASEPGPPGLGGLSHLPLLSQQLEDVQKGHQQREVILAVDSLGKPALAAVTPCEPTIGAEEAPVTDDLQPAVVAEWLHEQQPADHAAAAAAVAITASICLSSGRLALPGPAEVAPAEGCSSEPFLPVELTDKVVDVGGAAGQQRIAAPARPESGLDLEAPARLESGLDLEAHAKPEKSLGMEAPEDSNCVVVEGRDQVLASRGGPSGEMSVRTAVEPGAAGGQEESFVQLLQPRDDDELSLPDHEPHPEGHWKGSPGDVTLPEPMMVADDIITSNEVGETCKVTHDVANAPVDAVSSLGGDAAAELPMADGQCDVVAVTMATAVTAFDSCSLDAPAAGLVTCPGASGDDAVQESLGITPMEMVEVEVPLSAAGTEGIGAAAAVSGSSDFESEDDDASIVSNSSSGEQDGEASEDKASNKASEEVSELATEASAEGEEVDDAKELKEGGNGSPEEQLQVKEDVVLGETFGSVSGDSVEAVEAVADAEQPPAAAVPGTAAVFEVTYGNDDSEDNDDSVAPAEEIEEGESEEIGSEGKEEEGKENGMEEEIGGLAFAELAAWAPHQLGRKSDLSVEEEEDKVQEEEGDAILEPNAPADASVGPATTAAAIILLSSPALLRPSTPAFKAHEAVDLAAHEGEQCNTSASDLVLNGAAAEPPLLVTGESMADASGAQPMLLMAAVPSAKELQEEEEGFSGSVVESSGESELEEEEGFSGSVVESSGESELEEEEGEVDEREGARREVRAIASAETASEMEAESEELESASEENEDEDSAVAAHNKATHYKMAHDKAKAVAAPSVSGATCLFQPVPLRVTAPGPYPAAPPAGLPVAVSASAPPPAPPGRTTAAVKVAVATDAAFCVAAAAPSLERSQNIVLPDPEPQPAVVPAQQIQVPPQKQKEKKQVTELQWHPHLQQQLAGKQQEEKCDSRVVAAALLESEGLGAAGLTVPGLVPMLSESLVVAPPSLQEKQSHQRPRQERMGLQLVEQQQARKRIRMFSDWVPKGYVSEGSVLPLLPQEREDGVLVYEAPYAPGLFDLRPVAEPQWPSLLHNPRHRRRFLRDSALHSAHRARHDTVASTIAQQLPHQRHLQSLPVAARAEPRSRLQVDAAEMAQGGKLVKRRPAAAGGADSTRAVAPVVQPSKARKRQRGHEWMDLLQNVYAEEVNEEDEVAPRIGPWAVLPIREGSVDNGGDEEDSGGTEEEVVDNRRKVCLQSQRGGGRVVRVKPKLKRGMVDSPPAATASTATEDGSARSQLWKDCVALQIAKEPKQQHQKQRTSNVGPVSQTGHAPPQRPAQPTQKQQKRVRWSLEDGG